MGKTVKLFTRGEKKKKRLNHRNFLLDCKTALKTKLSEEIMGSWFIFYSHSQPWSKDDSNDLCILLLAVFHIRLSLKVTRYNLPSSHFWLFPLGVFVTLLWQDIKKKVVSSCTLKNRCLIIVLMILSGSLPLSDALDLNSIHLHIIFYSFVSLKNAK